MGRHSTFLVEHHAQVDRERHKPDQPRHPPDAPRLADVPDVDSEHGNRKREEDERGKVAREDVGRCVLERRDRPCQPHHPESVEDVRAMIAAKNRKVASKTMPAEGLYLMKINYEGEK